MLNSSYSMEEWVRRIQNSGTSNALSHQLALLCQQNGFEYYSLCLTLRRGIRQTDLTLLTHTPEGWADSYTQTSTIQNDPLFLQAQTQTSPIVWQKVSHTREALEQDPMKQWHQFGMDQGIALPLHGPTGFCGYLALSRTGKEPLSVHQYFHLLCITPYLLEQAFKIFTPEHSGLSGREKECLFWVSEGKTSWEIAQILGITERTVNFHLNNAIRKSGCKNRYQTVAKSIITGELSHAVTRVSLRNLIQHTQTISV